MNKRNQSGTAEICGYNFKDASLLDEALIHPSLNGRKNYQRIEFLGDRVLGLVVADWLLREFPSEAEGKLNRRFTALVRRETLAEITNEMEIMDRVKMAASADNDGTRTKEAVQADICEAVIGAVYLDGGLEPARDLIHKYWHSRVHTTVTVFKDHKTQLQEWAQARGFDLPAYSAVGRTGPDHSPIFILEVSLGEHGAAKGEGSSKRIAEQAAAEALLERITNK